MNIVTPTPTTVVFPTGNLSAESARRDNVLRETIPQTTENQQGEPERGLGSEGDRARNATGQFSNPLVYERPSVQNQASSDSTATQQDTRDNGSDESAGREEAEQRQQELIEQAEVRDLRARDREVRAHEQAHASVGGQYAGAPRYEFEVGPDGRRYAVGGEVSIDISVESTPEETARKMQQVRAAALAPANPSPQDFRVAAEANQRAFEARTEIQQQSAEAASNINDDEENDGGFQPPTLDDIVDGNRISTPTRTLDQAQLNESDSIVFDDSQESEQADITSLVGERTLDIDEDTLARRNGVISQFYQQAVAPRDAGFAASA